MSISASIIIPTKERFETLQHCLLATIKQLSKEDEVMVVENGQAYQKTKHLINILAKNHQISYVHESRLGPAFARNKGISLARNEILIFLDDDCVPGPGWLKAIKKRHENEKKHQQTVVFQGKINYVYKKSNAFVELFHLRNRMDWQVIRKTPGWKMGKFINFLNAGIFSVRRSVLVKNKIKFNELFFPFVGEERDLTAQLHLHGISIVYASEIQVTHYKDRGSVVNSLKRSFQAGLAQEILNVLYKTNQSTKSLFKKSFRKEKNGIIAELLKQFNQQSLFTITGMIITYLRLSMLVLGRVYGKFWCLLQKNKLYEHRKKLFLSITKN
ncbi:MAG: hypothetical protein A2383_00655 [Candidatus Pacebacteria bacterium RIFOXYB1_FULL_39_46]|nr:MAG: hypothetical protein A2182_00485 [Candidatus Pacebacteria bacterium RIFOXYA1_FULL_38_18]OGJ38097.1 MAG: hypothetical protein A2383_00655 [Candidatus Pacebacteria bacterium RIFOXYB1_FULL_39_46]OGJ39682.1 MAG: hypothetical protein A2411_02790 [Candidatus Pacebacteria bacterium RIFOXYC1_FULL_39_21]OGJ39849.1 MAG: hypothetical protein A2582_00420 [Candidatus Pacebacteria bacterium RIFOXYD1_FULL_39_27]